METKKLLLVDDVELFLQLEKTFLKRKSFEIYTAGTGIEALKMTVTIKPDLILLDLLLPDLDGDTVCRKLKGDAATCRIPIIIVTTAGDPGNTERITKSGCDAFLTKPIKRDELMLEVEKQLGIPQRKHRRVHTDVECILNLKGDTYDSFIGNISEGGAFVLMESPPPKGSNPSVSFKLPGSVHPIVTQASVCWRGKLDGLGPMGCGINFMTIGDQERGLIREFVNNELDSMENEYIYVEETEYVTIQ